MNKVKIIVEGYAIEKGDAIFATSNTVLIQTPKLNIIADPGINKKLLLDGLKKGKPFNRRY